jgi:hypothetical protein
MPPALIGQADDSVVEVITSEGSDDLDQSNLRISRQQGGKYLRLNYSDGTVFVINGEYDTIWATWPEPATVEDTATYLLGPVLAYLLRLRGNTCLHASAVAIGNRAIALAGPSGAGKSSLAAAFARMGYPVLSDDVVVLSESRQGFGVQPAYPRVRLWPESVDGLFGSPEALPRITPSWNKRFMDLTGPGYRFQSTPLPLAAIYLLGDRSGGASNPAVEASSPRAALMALVSDTCATSYLDPPRRATEFGVLGRLVMATPTRRATAVDDLSNIDALCGSILRDFDTLAR